MRRPLLVAIITLGGVAAVPQENRHDAALVARAAGRTFSAFWTLGLVWADYKWSLRALDKESEQYSSTLAECHQRAADRLLILCRRNGGTYVKMGQMIVAARPAVPKQFSETLQQLLDQGQPSSLAEVHHVIQRDKGVPLEDIFVNFEEQPLGCASLAQVHRAQLKSSGQLVAVKVQHERLRHDAPADLWTLRQAIRLLEWSFKGVTLQWFYPIASDNLHRELDFVHEASNAESCAHNFRNNPHVVVPRIYWDYTTSHVLTMEFIEAPRIDNRNALKAAGISSSQAAKLLIDIFAQMMFVHGFVHCDPHPGNLLVRWNPANQRCLQLVLLDHGLYREVNPEFRLAYCEMWKAMVLRDKDGLRKACDKMGVGPYAELFPIALTGRPISSQTPLGQKVAIEEVKKAREASGFKERSFAGLTAFMASLPEDLIFMFRTKGMIRALSHDLEASSADRFRAYANMAAFGLRATPQASAGFSLAWSLQQFEALAFACNVAVMEWSLRWLQWFRMASGNQPSAPMGTGPVGH